MHKFPPHPFLLLGLAVLAGCSTPPKPPSVDESTWRPANAADTVALQRCSNELQNARLRSAEADRVAEDRSAALAGLAALKEALAARAPVPRLAVGNLVYTVRFDFGSAQLHLSDAQSRALVEAARGAPLVWLRGRTDGATDSVAESRLARDRAAAVRDHLVAAGLDPARLRLTYQGAGDPVAENDTRTGRALNRRVEIEIYRSAPEVRTWSAPAPAP